MPFELFIALRYLVSRRKHSFISAISFFSVFGVAIGVAALIVVLGVMNGFSKNLRDKILGVNADLIVSKVDGGFEEYSLEMESIEKISGVKAVMPFVYSEVMLSTPSGVKGSVIRGISSDRAGEVLDIQKHMRLGSLQELQAQKSTPGILLGSKIARNLGVTKGDTVNLLSPSGKETSAGFSPEIERFRVAGIFETGMYQYDSSLVYTTIPAAQDLLGYDTDLITGLEVKLQDINAASEISKKIREVLPDTSITVRTWMDMNKNLFSALKLEKTAMAIILVMIVLVGSFSIITTLIMLVMEKRRDIAVLMSMGARRLHIRRIFIWQGTIIGFIGTVLGFLLGLGISFLLQEYQFIQLPSDVYYLSQIPISLEYLDLGLIAAATMTLCFLATLYPARQASKI
ncbi:MAG: lipoprotein-releasing ABC transporter permease subunit, partial [Thermodesulfobacteriota bacterium]